jgi:hypothetical protein
LEVLAKRRVDDGSEPNLATGGLYACRLSGLGSDCAVDVAITTILSDQRRRFDVVRFVHAPTVARARATFY